MRSLMSKLALAGAVISLSAGSACAQPAGLPEQLFNTTRPADGDVIRFCIDELSVGAQFDRAVAQAIADALFLKALFVVAPSGFALGAGGYEDELRLAMTNNCDAMPGMSLQPDSPLTSWATFSRAYASIPFVVAVTDPSYQSLGDIPKTETLGTPLGSIGENGLLVYQAQLPEDQRWRRLPYANPQLMLTRLLDGSLGGIMLWAPMMRAAINANPDAGSVRIVSSDPLPEQVVAVATLVSGRDTFLRTQIDDAIGALVDDGTIARLMAEFQIVGTPG